MKHLFFTFLACISLLAACRQNNTAITLANDTDPVCDMEVKASSADTLLYQGKIYGFCSPSCKEEFVANPQQYLAKMNAPQ